MMDTPEWMMKEAAGSGPGGRQKRFEAGFEFTREIPRQSICLISYIRYDWTVQTTPRHAPFLHRPRNPWRRAIRRRRGRFGARVQPAVSANQGVDPAEPAGGRVETRRGHSQRDGPGGALPRE